MGFARWVVFGLAVQVSCGCSLALAEPSVVGGTDCRREAPTHHLKTGSHAPREWPQEVGLLLLGLLARRDTRAAVARRLLGLSNGLNAIDREAFGHPDLPLRPSIQPAFSCAMREDGSIFCEGPRYEPRGRSLLDEPRGRSLLGANPSTPELY